MQNNKYKMILLVLVPFFVGWIINLLMSYISLGFSLISIWKFGAIFYWFWVGRQFSNLRIEKYKSFILGNVIWMISFVLYIWQFLLVDAVHRNLFLAGLSQHYILGFVGWASKTVRLFTNSIASNTVIIIAYLIMLIVFALGFSTSSSKNKY